MVCRAELSALTQTYANREVVIVVDDPKPTTVAAPETLNEPRLCIVAVKDNEGGSEARNIGAREAQSNRIPLLDNDNEWLSMHSKTNRTVRIGPLRVHCMTTTKMKVCFLAPNFYRSSGVAVAIKRLVSAMCGRGLKFYLAGCGAPTEGGLSPIEDASWAPVGRYRTFDLFRTGPRLVRELIDFSRWVKDIECDVVHVHHRRLACLANVARLWNRIPVIYTAHGVYSRSMIMSALCPSTVTGVSPSVMEYLARCTGATTRILAFNPYPFPLLPAERILTPFAVLSRAVSIGRLEPVKGHIHLINAWQILRSRGMNVHLDIYGEGHLRCDLISKVKAEGLDGVVRFPGYSGDVSRELRTSLFNVLVSETEGFPNVVVEAAAESVPTLLTDVDGSRDAVPENTKLPNRLPFGNVPALANALARWFESPETVALDGQRFFEFMRQRVSFDVVRAQYEEIYATAANRFTAAG